MAQTEKAKLRQAARARRSAIPAPKRAEFAAALPRFMPDLLAFCAALSRRRGQQEPQIFALYHACGTELDPAPLLAALRAAGKQTALPAMAKDGNMVFRLAAEQTELECGALGFYAPCDAAPVCAPQAVLLPLLAYDAAGHRLGQGGGHYDRALRALCAKGKVPLVGLSFSAQELPIWQAEPHDVDLDAALSERGLRQF